MQEHTHITLKMVEKKELRLVKRFLRIFIKLPKKRHFFIFNIVIKKINCYNYVIKYIIRILKGGFKWETKKKM